MFRLIVRMAWLNVWRRKARSLLVIIMIAVSMGVMLSIQGLYDGMTKHMIDSTIRSDSGEISIYAPSYRLQQSLTYTMHDSQKLISELRDIPQITAVAQRIHATGLVSTARKSTMAKMIGIDVQSEEAFGKFEAFLIDGNISWGEEGYGTLIGKKLAKTLGVTLESRIIFSSQNRDGELSSVALRIKGIIQTTNPAIDDMGIFVSLERAEIFTGLDREHRTQIA